MNKKTKKGLKLSTETLRNLAPESLERAAGGTVIMLDPSIFLCSRLPCSMDVRICKGPSPWNAPNSNGGISGG